MFSKKMIARMVTVPAIASAVGVGMLVVPAEAAAPPSCVTTSVSSPTWIERDLRVYNGCASSSRLKTIWAFDLDGACATLASRGTRTENRLVPARFDGLQIC